MELDVTPIDVAGFVRKVDDIIFSEASKLADDASAASQIGVTGEFKRSWRAVRLGVDVAVINTAAHALQALVGISPRDAARGNRNQKINSIAEWAGVILGISDEQEARNVARLILDTHIRQGSTRYRSGKNFLGIDPDTGEPTGVSPVFTTAEIIAARINALSI